MFPDVTIWNPKKGTNERASEYDISIAFPFPVVTICKPQTKWTSQWACSAVRVTNIPALQLTHCACICIRFNSDTFSTDWRRSPNYDTILWYWPILEIFSVGKHYIITTSNPVLSWQHSKYLMHYYHIYLNYWTNNDKFCINDSLINLFFKICMGKVSVARLFELTLILLSVAN
jgi:hypothetical protein